MYYKIIRNDISKSRVITLAIMLFVAAAAMLVSLAVILTVNLSGTIDTLMKQAETPHFMQMHSGEIDTARLAAFAEKNSAVEAFQVAEFLNIDSAQMIFDGKPLRGSVQDNGLSTQNEKFDYLLDLDGKAINVKDGELYVPICYMKDGTAKVGDKAVISGSVFNIAGFLRDSQMNSALSYSKRFLVSKNDYEKIKSFGNVEYLIEFRLKDMSMLSSFESAYTAYGLEANGPTVTYPLFKMLNAISDGLMIAVILLVSFLVAAIALLCIRFTLLAKIEEDYREIGVMKAIGLRVSDIKKIYLAKYMALAAAGCILGFVLAFMFKGVLLENIRLFMGESEKAYLGELFGMLSVLFVFAGVTAYVSGVLRRFRKISSAEAIRFGTSQENSATGKSFCLSQNTLLNTNIFLGIKELLTKKKLYATMLLVLVISAFIIIVPANMYHTISAKSFITYMGIGNCDMRLDIQQTEDILGKTAEIAKTMSHDKAISKYTVLTTKTFTAIMEDGSEKRLKIELGDHLVFPVKYSKGRAPVVEDEIALSAMNADELQKKAGDIITLSVDGKIKKLKICGIYSDITNGGKTAKAVFNAQTADTMWSIINAELSDKSQVNSKVLEYADNFRFAKASGIDEYIKQTFGDTLDAVKKASYAATAAALIITILVTLLFMKMLVSKDRYAIAVMKTLGFTNADITVQYISRSVCVLMIAIVLGILLANTLGEVLAGAVISSFGASSFKFAVSLLSAYLICPLVMLGAVLSATLIGVSGTKQIKISENIKE